jgi:hypothetical protein
MTDPLRFIAPPDETASTTATDEPAAAEVPASSTISPGPGPTPATPAQPSAAEQRFQSCRWRKPETPPFCSHPEVLPFAGTNGFNPDSWCPGCAFYKLRRNPRRDY